MLNWSIRKYGALLFMLVLTANTGIAQKRKSNSKGLDRPKLVVGIVVDQMRYDYLYRYWEKYSDGGFKRLMKDGFNFRNNHYNYVPTYTAPGHASIYTGTTPAMHGIVGNDWFNRATGKSIYCTEDKSVKTVGSTTTAGEMSPANLLATTITDELKLATNQQSKVIGVSLKDRGSILPAGHAANAAYWFDGTNGNMITSTFYMQELPAWVKAFNDRKLGEELLSKPWNTLLPIEQYTESTADDQSFEGTYAGEQKPVFPHNLPALKGNNYELIRSTPMGNTYTREFAMAAIQAEQMGQDDITDFLAVSFSSPDYVGHQFGPNSIEVEDNYLRLDRDLADLLSYLDKTIGKENVLVFLTADHAAAHNPTFLKQLRIPAGTTFSQSVVDSLKAHLNEKFGKAEWVSSFMNQQIYLNHNLIQAKKADLVALQEETARFLQQFPGVMRVITSDALTRSHWEQGVGQLIENGYMPFRSGDVIVTLQPGWYEGYGRGEPKGTTHGSTWSYDTHVPLLWYGWQVPAGESVAWSTITDIAPTLAAWLHIQEPNGATGRALQVYMQK